MKLPTSTPVDLHPTRDAVAQRATDLAAHVPFRLRTPWEARLEQAPSRGRQAVAVVGATAVAGILVLFVDPHLGAARLHRATERSRAFARQGRRRARSRTAYATGRARGRVARLRGLGTPTPVDDVEVKNQVRQVLARHDFHRADVLIDVCDGMATLRGQLATAEEIDLAESLVRDVAGVEGLVNLLHLPGQPAPNKVLALRAV